MRSNGVLRYILKDLLNKWTNTDSNSNSSSNNNKSKNKIKYKSISKKSQQKHQDQIEMAKPLRCVHDFLQDLFTACLITIAVYILMVLTLYSLVALRFLDDPASQSPLDTLQSMRQLKCNHQNINNNNNNIDSSDNDEIEEEEIKTDVFALNEIVKQVLKNKKNKYEHFLCYRTLFDLLRIRTPFHFAHNTIDLCVIDKGTTSKSSRSKTSSNGLVQNVKDQLGYSHINEQLNEISKVNKKLKCSQNRLLGYFELNYGRATFFLFMFVKSPETRLEFETASRHNLLHLSGFNHLINKLGSKQEEKEVEILDRDDVWNFTRNGFIDTFHDSVRRLTRQRVPLSLLDSIEYSVELAGGGAKFPMATSSHELLMHFYPNLWWRTIDNCTI